MDMVVEHPALLDIFLLYMTYQSSIFIFFFGKFFWILVLFFPKFYWDIFYTNKDKVRSIWAIFSKPVSTAVSNIIHCCRDNATTLSDALVTATSVPCNTRDPLRIKKPYAYLTSIIPDVPDRMIMRILCILEIVIVCLWPILTGTVSLTSWLIFWRFFCLQNSATTKGRKNPRHRKWKQKCSSIQKYKKQRVLPEIRVNDFMTSNINNDNAFSFDIDGILFVIDNSTTANM